MSAPTSLTGRQLWALLPLVYRHRDRGDLAGYVDACGEILDLVRHTLDQRLADCFPDRPPEGRAVQGWILPYLGQLLDARLLSPHLEGRRREVGRAVAWRQRKGTLRGIEEIAEAVGQVEVEVQEGWRRVAVTPRIGLPLAPEPALGLIQTLDAKNPAEAARHPALPVVTPDFRRACETRDVATEGEDPEWRLRFFPARAFRISPGKPAARDTADGVEDFEWRLPHPHGAPRFDRSYEDVSRRTVDLRTPDHRRGFYHPRRLLLFAAPPTGFFPPTQQEIAWNAPYEPADQGPLRVVPPAEGRPRLIFHPDPFMPDRQEGTAVTVEDATLDLDRDEVVRIQDLDFLGTIRVTKGRLELRRVAARRLVVESGGSVTGEDEVKPALDAVDCLFETVEVENGLARLEYCTVRRRIVCHRLQASDCIFAGEVEIGAAGIGSSCIRYSRIPRELKESEEVRWPANTTENSAFHAFEICDAEGDLTSAAEFGQPGYGVLHPATPEAIRFGAEDGGEMGAYHHRRYTLQDAAVLEKLRDFLPLGLEAVWIPDPRLLALPPEPKATPDD